MRSMGFLGQRVIWPNIASFTMLPRDGFEVGRLGPFFSAGSFYVSSMGLYCSSGGVLCCSLSYPYYCKPSLF